MVGFCFFFLFDYNDEYEYNQLTNVCFTLFSTTDAKTFSPLELIVLCRLSTDIMWDQPIGRPLFRNLCGVVLPEHEEEIPKPDKMNLDFIEDKNESVQPFG